MSRLTLIAILLFLGINIELYSQKVIDESSEKKETVNVEDDRDVERKSSFGIWAHYANINHDAEFSRLPGIPSCCPEFTGAKSHGFAAGFLYELPLFKQMFLDFRFGYFFKAGILTDHENEFISYNGIPTLATIEHNVTATLGSIAFEPTLGFRLWNGLSLNLGINAGYVIPHHFKQTEYIIDPPNGAFDPAGRESWLYYEGDTLDNMSYNLDFVARLSYEFPLNSARTVWLAPEIAYNYGLTSVFNAPDWDGRWDINIFRAGIAIKFSSSYGLQMELTPESQPLYVNKYELCDNRTNYFCMPDTVAFSIEHNSEVGIKNYNYSIKHKDIVLDWNDVNVKELPGVLVWDIPLHLPEKLYNLSDSLTYVVQIEDIVGQKRVDSSYLVVHKTESKLSSAVQMYSIEQQRPLNSIFIEDLVNGSRTISMTAKPDQVYFKTGTTSLGNLKKWKFRIRTTNKKLYDTAAQGNPPERLYLGMNNILKRLPSGYDEKVYYSLEIIDSMGNICEDEQYFNLNRQELSVMTNYRTFGRTIVDSSYIDRENPTIRIEERISTRLQPLLNYVFFEENASELSARYKKLTSSMTNSFDIDDMHDLPTLKTYYNVLNIIGKRLREKNAATITITGCNSDEGIEKNNKELSAARAQSVFDYLNQVWKIPAERLIIAEPRDRPEQASSSKKRNTQDYQDGVEENRRVEITSDDYDIVKPILTYGKRYMLNPTEVFFIPEIDADMRIQNWEFNVKSRDIVIDSFANSGMFPDTLFWNVEKRKIDIADSRISFLNTDFSIETTKGLTAFAENVIPIEIVSKSEGEGKDTTYDEYSLILFDFGSNKIGDNNQKIIDIIKERVNPGAIVSIVGHTDRVGKEKANIRLSTKRSKSADKALNFDKSEYSVSSRGAGEDELLYPNGLPEARFYCRTVKIEVANPVIK